MGDGFVTFKALQNRSSIGLERLSGSKGIVVSGGKHTLEYSTDGTNWTNMPDDTTITLNSGDSVYIRGTIAPTSGSKDFSRGSQYTQFKMSGKIAASGNCNALWDYINATSNTTIEIGKDWGYHLFYNCTALTTAPELPSTKLAEGCYYTMFSNCTSLTKAPELPATTLANNCYEGMFNGCTSLTKAPELPATTLVELCYQNMFNGCSSLNYIKCLATDISATYCTRNWVNGVSQTGTFVRPNTMSNWETGVDGIPYGWVESDKPIKYEDIANELLRTIPIESVPYQFLYQTYLSEYLDMGYNRDAYDTVYELILQYSPNVFANVETFVVSNDSNEKVITVDNNGDFYLKGVGGYDGKNTKVEDSNIKPLQDVISATGTIYTAGNNIDITNNVITSKGYTYNNGTITTDGSVTVQNNLDIVSPAGSTPTLKLQRGLTDDSYTDFLIYGQSGNLKIDKSTSGTQTNLLNLNENGELTVNGSEKITGKITATNAESHNLAYLGNELNLADVTSGNKLYLNFRNSTEPINEYIFCQGKGVPATEQRSDITCGNLNTSESIRSNFKLFNISSSDNNLYSRNINTVGWYKVAEIDGAMGANGTLHIGTAYFNSRPESYIVNFAEGWNDDSYYKYAVNAIILGNQSFASDVLIDKIGFIKSKSSPYTLSIYIHYNATVENNVSVALETGSGNITGGGTRFYTLTYDSAITDASFTNIYSTKSGVNLKGFSNDFITLGNELNLSDVTSGNICYLNYRGSTNPINEYRLCKGISNQSTYSDIRCGTLYQTSDITKKNVISDLDLDKAYDLIDKCQTIIYTLKDDERNKEQIGVIAQEIQEFFPEVVSADENGILAIDYSRLTVVIMKVLKDVIKRVQRLEEK